MVSVCLPSDALLQHLPSYLGFSYLGRGVFLHGCSSKVQLLFLTLDKGYLLTTAPPDLERGVAPLGPPVSAKIRVVIMRWREVGRLECILKAELYNIKIISFKWTYLQNRDRVTDLRE